jgi:cell division protein FtsB
MHVAHRQLQDEQGQAKEMERLRAENAAMHAANRQLQERNASLQSMATSMFERMQAAARMLTSQPY